jgi:ribosomal protein S18 acetylase RimI-like enzyme
MIADEDATIGRMPLPIIRPMTPADVDAASEAILRQGWGERRAQLTFAAADPGSHAFVADLDGAVVGTGIATMHGLSAWIGTIWVDEASRRTGLGSALTQATIDAAEAAGARTLLLVATDAGRRLYEKIGFEVETTYRILEAPGVAGTPDPRMRAFRDGDLEAIAGLDGHATGEDRSRVLRAFTGPDTTRCLELADGTLGGFVVRAPWGGGATVAPDIEDAVGILQARRITSGPGKHIRAGLLAENEAGLDRLVHDGWTEAWDAPRMIRGEPLDWDPAAIWGQFNHAMG